MAAYARAITSGVGVKLGSALNDVTRETVLAIKSVVADLITSASGIAALVPPPVEMALHVISKQVAANSKTEPEKYAVQSGG